MKFRAFLPCCIFILYSGEHSRDKQVIPDKQDELPPSPFKHGTKAHDSWKDLFVGKVDVLSNAKKKYPYLFSSEEDLKAISSRLEAEPEWAKKYLSIDLDKPIPHAQGVSGYEALKVAHLALAWRLTGKSKYLDKFRAWIPVLDQVQPGTISKMTKWDDLDVGHFLLGIAIAYDLSIGHLSDKKKNLLEQILIKHASKAFSDLASDPRGGCYSYDQNHWYIPVAGLGVAALALRNEAQAAKWRIFSRNFMNRALEILSQDGLYFEGAGYWGFAFRWHIIYAETLKRMTGEDWFDRPQLKNSAIYIAHSWLPGFDQCFDWADTGGWDTKWHKESAAHPLPYPLLGLLRYNDSPFTQWIASRLLEKEKKHFGSLGVPVFNLLWDIPQVRKLSASPIHKDAPWLYDTFTKITEAKPWHYFNDHEVLYWRSSWVDPKATAISFKCGPAEGHSALEKLGKYPEWKMDISHVHPDSGSFILYSRGSFLANDTGYLADPEREKAGKSRFCAKKSKDHNTILVDGNGQFSERSRADNMTHYADKHNPLRLEHIWTSSSIVAATADVSCAYADSLKVTRMKRHLILLDGRYFVLVDEMEASTPRVWTWLWHVDCPPKLVTGGWSLENGDAKIHVRSFMKISVDSKWVSPLSKIAKTFIGDDQITQRGFHVEEETESTKWARFVHLAEISDKSDSQPFAGENAQVVEGGITFSNNIILWGNSGHLNGDWAWLLREKDGSIKKVGLAGKELKYKDVRILCEPPGKLELVRVPDGWDVVYDLAQKTRITIEGTLNGVWQINPGNQRIAASELHKYQVK